MSKDGTRTYGERRVTERHPVRVDVNYRHGDTYLFSTSKDVSELGIFLVSATPLPRGSSLELRFGAGEGGESIDVAGEVMWVEPGGMGRDPGMGVRFSNPSPEMRERIRSLIRTMAYLE
ncbi:MAG: PilZ domain-containing protein [Deltaproteobacteria bacterium]|nr:PilZ domain-containing protein [Deltaproteobacteria bacterium]